MSRDASEALFALAGSEFLREWHARYAGATSQTHSFAQIDGDGRSSYQVLVDDVATLSPAGEIVDLACGDGYLLALLHERLPEARLIGVDMSPEELSLAARRALTESTSLVQSSVEALPLRDASVGAVVCHLALMLFDDATKVLHEVARVLRPGGIFAAVLGPARGSSAMVADFFRHLRAIEVSEELPPLRLGDPATYSEEFLRALFAGSLWSSLEIDQVRLRFDGSDEQIRAVLLAMYNVARLSEKGRFILELELTAELLKARGAGQSPDFVLGLHHLVAKRAG